MLPSVCRKVVEGMDTVFKLDKLPTKTEGMFVMPMDRITIHSTFLVYVDDPLDIAGTTTVLDRNDVAMAGAFRQESPSTVPGLTLSTSPTFSRSVL